jgi:hypothetical protein
MEKNTQWYRNLADKLDADIKKAEASLDRLKQQRKKALQSLAPLAAKDCAESGRRFLGQWTVGTGIAMDADEWDILMNPSSFEIKKGWGVDVWARGTILLRRKTWKEGIWKLIEGVVQDGKRFATLQVFEGTTQLYRFRKATRKEVDAALMIIAATEKKENEDTNNAP